MSRSLNIDFDTEEKRVKRELPQSEAVDLNISVFNYLYSWKTIRGFFHNIAYFFRCLRAGYDRATKGYCRRDTWNLDTTLISYMIKVLTEYRNSTNCWNDQEFESFEDWIEYIDATIDLLIYSITSTESLSAYHEAWETYCCGKDRSTWTEKEMSIYNSYLNEVAIIFKSKERARRQAFERLAKYLPDIWW